MTTVPHLSLEGFITNKKIIMIKLMEHFLASDYSQSNMFKGQVASLKYLLEQYKTKEELIRVLTKTLNDMYSKHFATVDVMVTVDDPEDSGTQLISIDILAVDFDNEEYTLSRNLEEVDGKVKTFDTLEEEIKNGH